MAGIPTGNNVPSGGNILSSSGNVITGNNVPSSTFAPLGSPLLWYDAAISGAVDGGTLGTWPTTGSLPSTWDVVQAVGASRPTYRAVGSAGKMNNAPAVQFDGNDFMASATGLSLQAQTLVWYLVAKVSGAGNEIYISGAGANINQIYSAARNITVYAGSFGTTGQLVNAGGIHSMFITVNGASSTLALDGTTGGAVNSGALGIDNVILGSSAAGANAMTGLFYVAGCYAAASAPTLAAANAYGASRWGATPQ